MRAWRFGAQATFAEDPARRKVLRKGRRAGGSEGIGTILLEVADKAPGSVCPYITLTKGTARQILWPKLKRLNRMLDLDLVFNETLLTARLPNGSTIWLTGADKQDEIEKLRGGDQGHPIAALDEVQSFGSFLETLVEEVLGPAVAEHDGSILLSGTPHAACAGYFFDADTGKAPGWSRHHFTLLDNPHFRGGAGAAYLEEVKRERGWTDETPAYRREYLGLWCRSDEDLCYAYAPERNDYSGELPAGVDWRYVLGVDLGYDDAFSMRSWAYAPEHPAAYVVDHFDASGLIPEKMAHAIQGARENRRYTEIVIDQGGLGKAIAEEFRQRYNIPCVAAEKSKKREFIQLMNSDWRTGKLKVPTSDKKYREELSQLQWDESGQREDPRFSNHACDAALYSWRECQHWIYREKAVDPEPGTAAHFAAEAQRMRKVVEQRVKASKSNRGGSWFPKSRA